MLFKVNIITSFRYRLSWPVLIRLVAAGKFGDLNPMITHTFPIEETVKALETCADRSCLAIKVQVCPVFNSLVSVLANRW